ncbi:hypothetical protein BJ742DRAFT_41733 [Cladochytrium replicatum]|nr:hypothetical protein BJ742DRAFT_41733 [Cladochytrium replicatum]
MNGPPAPKRTDVPTANHDGMQMSNPSPEEADDKVFWKTSPPAARKLAEIVDHRVLRENSGTYGEKLSGENTSENRGLRVDRSNLVESNGAEFVPIANQRTTPRGFKRAVTISNIPGDSPTTRKRTCTHWAQRGKPLPVEITPAPSINKTSCGLPLNDVTEKSPRGSNARMARSISSPTVLSKSRQSVDQKKPTRPLREITENVNHSSSTANHGSKSIGTGEVQSKSTLETEKENLPGPLHGTPNTVKDQLSRERKSGLDQAQLLNSKSSGTFAKSKDVSGATVIRSKKRQQKFHRCIVMRVAYGKFSLNNGLVADEKVLHMLSLESDTKILAHLRGDWIETEGILFI